MDTRSFAEAFWELYQSQCRPAIESACVVHLRRTGTRSIDLDDMVSWIDCRVWRIVRERPPELMDATLGPEEATLRIARAAGMLARWAHLALVRSATKRAARERCTADIEVAIQLAQSRSSSSTLESSESTSAALNTLRAGLGAELRGKLAASWKEPTERERIATALDASRPEDERLREQIYAGEIRTNTVEQMRSRSLSRSRATMKSCNRAFLAFVLAATMSLFTAPQAFASGGGSDGGEQTGGRSAAPSL